MAKDKYSLLEAIKPQLSDKTYRKLCNEIVFKKRMKVLEALNKQVEVDL